MRTVFYSLMAAGLVGRTDRHGTAVEDRPISVRDFLATVCRVLGIDYTKKITTPNGRWHRR